MYVTQIFRVFLLFHSNTEINEYLDGAFFRCRVLAASNEKQNANERLLVRWRRSLNRYCKCCSGMRCLACRRDPKGTLFGIKKPGKKTVSSIDAPQSTAAAATNASSAPKNKFSCWPKLKTRCR